MSEISDKGLTGPSKDFNNQHSELTTSQFEEGDDIEKTSKLANEPSTERDPLSESEQQVESKALDNSMPGTKGGVDPDNLKSRAAILTTLRSIVESRIVQGIVAIVAATAALIALIPVVSPVGDQSFRSSVLQVKLTQTGAPTFVVPSSLDDVDRPPSATSTVEEIDKWRTENSGVYADELGVSFTARSDLEEPSILTALRVEVVDRKPPMQGSLIVPSGAGDLIPREARANLETDPPRVTLTRGWRFPLTVSKTNIELFVVTAQVKNCSCSWRIQVDVVAPDGTARTEIIDDNGKPFQVTSTQRVLERSTLPVDDSEDWPR